jgi:hypothetical protein
MMQSVEITRATVAGGRRVIEGEIVELTEADASTLIAMGKAVPVVDAPVPDKRDPVPDNREADVEEKTSKRTGSKAKK